MRIETDILLDIKKLAKQFVEENFTAPTPEDFLIVENAMMKAAILVTGRVKEWLQ